MVRQRGCEGAVLVGDLHVDVHVLFGSVPDAAALRDQLVIQTFL